MSEQKPILLGKNNKLLGVLPNDDVLSQCIHCGMCLATCPTYELTKLERSSPRGRIRMIKAVARGEMEITQVFADEMSFCLDCQACETACPAGVKYGSMVEAARVEVSHAGFGTFWGRIIKAVTLRGIIASRRNTKAAARLLYFYQNFGVQKFLHSSGLMKLVSRKLAEIDKLAPSVSKTFSDSIIPEISVPDGEIKHRTAFLTGCLMNVMFADVNEDTVDVLKASGCEVSAPKDQVCCGSLHAHNGDMKTAKELAKKNLDIFSRYKFDYMISNSAGCGAFMKEYGHLLHDDTKYAAYAAEFSAKVKDITEFIAENNEDIYKEISESATYHDACHLAHTQKITAAPRKALNEIPGLDMVPLEESTWCCGSAGIYNIVRYDDSMKILERKMENIKNTGVNTVLTGNPGCIQQIRYGSGKFNVPVEVLHPVTIMKRALKKSVNKKE